LTAARDLLRKGYGVTLFEPSGVLGGRLLEIPEELLPPRVIMEAVALLDRLGLKIRLNETSSVSELRQGPGQGFDVVYVGFDGRFPPECEVPGSGHIAVQPFTQTTDRDGLFAGGTPRHGGTRSPVWEAAEGRWAATSMDRLLQETTLTAGREKEGPYKTRLFTSLEGVSSLPAVPKEGLAYSRQAAEQEAGRCLQCQCLECVKVCA
jgi:hypothetical protein